MNNHEFADIFPMMDKKEYSDLKNDIKKNGLMESIITLNGEILDGRNRFRACEELGIDPKLKEFDGKDALTYVMSTNLQRRNLNQSQKAMVGRRWKIHYSKIHPQGKHHSEPVHSDDGKIIIKNSDKAGEIAGVSGRYIEMAEEVISKRPEMEEKIMNGEIKIKQVIRDIKLDEQKKEIEELKETTGEYDVIVIDPPWQYYENENYDSENYMGRVVAPYPTMSIQEIKNLKLPSSDNCVIWLWTTHRFIWDAIELLKNWGFEYKAILVWDKEKLGIGKTLRMQCEFCLLGFKGKPYWKMSNQRDIIREARTKHSVKPKVFYEFVESLCAGRKLDYFNQGRKREGWDSYGN